MTGNDANLIANLSADLIFAMASFRPPYLFTKAPFSKVSTAALTGLGHWSSDRFPPVNPPFLLFKDSGNGTTAPPQFLQGSFSAPQMVVICTFGSEQHLNAL